MRLVHEQTQLLFLKATHGRKSVGAECMPQPTASLETEGANHIKHHVFSSFQPLLMQVWAVSGILQSEGRDCGIERYDVGCHHM